MWLMKSIVDGNCHYFLTDIPYIIGRGKVKIAISNDNSISRKHAIMMATYIGNTSAPILRVTDCISRCGTYLNNIRIEQSKSPGRKLKNDDIIKFGLFQSEFRIIHQPLFVCCSCLDIMQQQNLKSTLRKLGAIFAPEWSAECTHLVMPNAKMTVKAISCLAALKPIVDVHYFEHLVTCWETQSNNSGLREEAYIPNREGEEDINKEKSNFKIIPERTTLFKGKTFIFTDENQLKKLKFAISAAGGTVVLLDEKEQYDAVLLVEGPCIVQPNMECQDSKKLSIFDGFSDIISKGGKRAIKEAEIGHAIICCSVEVYCNSDFCLNVNVEDTNESHIINDVPYGLEHFTIDYDVPTQKVECVFINDNDESQSRHSANEEICLSSDDDIIIEYESMHPIKIHDMDLNYIEQIGSPSNQSHHKDSGDSNIEKPNDEEFSGSGIQEKTSLVKVQFVDAVKQDVQISIVQKESTENKNETENVTHVGAQALPNIVGGRDLVLYDKFALHEPLIDWTGHHSETPNVDCISIDDNDDLQDRTMGKKCLDYDDDIVIELEDRPTKKQKIHNIDLDDIEQTGYPSDQSHHKDSGDSNFATNLIKAKSTPDCEIENDDPFQTSRNLEEKPKDDEFNESGIPEKTNLVKVQFVDVVKQDIQLPIMEKDTMEDKNEIDNVKNFKRFKKVIHVGTEAFPNVVGGRQLVPNDKFALYEPPIEWTGHHSDTQKVECISIDDNDDLQDRTMEKEGLDSDDDIVIEFEGRPTKTQKIHNIDLDDIEQTGSPLAQPHYKDCGDSNFMTSPIIAMNIPDCEKEKDDPFQTSRNLEEKPKDDELNESGIQEKTSLVKVQFVDAVKQDIQLSIMQKNTTEDKTKTENIKNFKHFKKVVHVGAQALPNIVGGRDLVPHDKFALHEPLIGRTGHHSELGKRPS